MSSEDTKRKKIVAEGIEKGFFHVTLDKDLIRLIVSQELNEQRNSVRESMEMLFYRYTSLALGIVGAVMVFFGLIVLFFTTNYSYGYPLSTITQYSTGTVVGIIIIFVASRFAAKYDSLSQKRKPKN